jgi:type I restriction enzyme R subunit
MSREAAKITESVVEQAALGWLESLDYAILAGPEIAPGEPASERASYQECWLLDRLESALARVNPKATPAARATPLSTKGRRWS